MIFTPKISQSKVRPIYSFRELTLNPRISNHNKNKIFWNTHEVQEAINLLINMNFYQEKPFLASYLKIYKKMTEKRDFERVHTEGTLKPKNSFNELLNDALADLMTKNYLRQMKAFVDHRPTIENILVKAEFNEILYYEISPLFLLMSSAEIWKKGDLWVAINSTLYYLYYNIAYAISALPHMKNLWKHRPEKTLAERVQRIKEYYPDFAKFNSFLYDNISTVIKVLNKNKRVDLLSSINNLIHLFKPVVKFSIYEIRDQAFQKGIDLINLFESEISHPYLQQAAWWPNGNIMTNFDSCNVTF